MIPKPWRRWTRHLSQMISPRIKNPRPNRSRTRYVCRGCRLPSKIGHIDADTPARHQHAEHSAQTLLRKARLLIERAVFVVILANVVWR